MPDINNFITNIEQADLFDQRFDADIFGNWALQNNFGQSPFNTYPIQELIDSVISKQPYKFNWAVTTFVHLDKNISVPSIRDYRNNSSSSIESPQSFRSAGVMDMNINFFKLYVVSSTDGVLLREYFNMAVIQKNDLVFFLEDNRNDVSDAVLLCKMGSDVKTALLKDQFLKQDMIRALNAVYKIDAGKFHTLLKNGEIKGYPWLDTADHIGKTLGAVVTFANSAVSGTIVEIMDLLVGKLKELKIPESGWLPPEGGSNDFVPFLVGSVGKEVVEGSAHLITSALAVCRKTMETYLQVIESFLKEKKAVKGFINSFLAKYLVKTRLYILAGIKALKKLEKNIQKLASLGVNALNAYLCGLVNGFVDAVIGLAELVKFIFNISKNSGELVTDLRRKLPPILEAWDNMVEAWGLFSFADFFDALGRELVRFLKAVYNEFAGGADEATMCRLAYFTGSAVGQILEMVVELAFTGAAATIGKFFKSFGEIGSKISGVVSRQLETQFKLAVKEKADDIFTALKNASRFIGASKEEMVKFIRSILDELKKLLGIGFKKEVEELMEKYGIEVGRKRIFSQANVGIPVLVGENKWALYHKDATIFEGTKEELVKFMKKLEAMPEGAVKKYLDELFEVKRFVKSVYGESRMSKMAIEFRRAQIPPNHGGNIAIFEYVDNAGNIVAKEFSTLSENELLAKGLDKSPHAEIIGMKWMEENKIPNSKIKRVYSELEPCTFTSSKCKHKLRSQYENALIEYSFDYPGENDVLKNERKSSIILRAEKLKRIFNL